MDKSPKYGLEPYVLTGFDINDIINKQIIVMKKGTNIDKTVAMLVKGLSVRNRDIITRRFGLKNGKRETLESIGKGYGITRERVRQIEEATLASLAKTVTDHSEFQGYIANARDVITKNGGVIKETNLFETITGTSKENPVNAALVFAMTLDSDLVKFAENDHFHGFWALSDSHLNNFKDSSTNVIAQLSKVGKVIQKDEFYNIAEKHTSNQKVADLVLALNKNVSSNIFDQVGLASWSEISPKGVRDKAYLVLKRENKPKHFSEIAKLINTYGFDNKRANIQTVHNELIKDLRFVLVGRGMYALNEWGYKPGTVKDVLIDILKDHGKPLSKASLVAKVMDSRMVKENTILLNLQDSKVFTKKEDGSYTLRGV